MVFMQQKMKASLLDYYNPTKVTVLQTDVSGYGIEYCLL